MRIQKRTMGWLPRASLYNEAQSRQAKQKAAHQAFLSTQSGLADRIGAINSDFASAQTQLVSNVAVARIKSKGKTA